VNEEAMASVGPQCPGGGGEARREPVFAKYQVLFTNSLGLKTT